MIKIKNYTISFWNIVFWIIIILGLYSVYVRFTQGLGASTNLSDAFPWGLWIGFDVLCGVGLAAGGFIIAATVYIFNLDKFKPILRPAILTAFLGYTLVGVSLLFDVGKPWNLWHPLIMWNDKSVMFEVAWCVMLYSTVLALEFSPVVLEKLKLETPLKIIHSITIPLVIAGVVLSTLHQSSLGTLYLIVPNKLYPLWYTSKLPYLFFLSAIAVGPAMVTIESFLSFRAFKKEIELHILSKLGKVTAVALSLYLIIKLEDLFSHHLVHYILLFNKEAILFIFEMLIGVIIPLILLMNKKVRNSKTGICIASALVILGFITNRLNISITALTKSAQVNYFPSFTEISITLMMVALGFAIFAMAAKYLPLFSDKQPLQPETEDNNKYYAISINDI